MKEPYYMIHFDAAACLFEIRVNDQPVLTMNLSGQASSKIPINYTISNSGKQEVTVTLLPLIGASKLSEKAYLNYHVELFESYNGFKLIDQFDGFESKPIEQKQALQVIKGNSFFEAEITYSLVNLWTKGENIEDIEDYSIKIKAAYQDIANLILGGKYEQFKQKMKNREYNMATSMYLSDKDSQNRINRMIEEFKNGYNHLLFDDLAIPVISAYGKKVALKSSNGEPALSFGNKEQQEQIMLDIEFYYSKETNQFEII